jgi:hypothetical protein
MGAELLKAALDAQQKKEEEEKQKEIVPRQQADSTSEG